ncbi:alginate lyase family protein [Candidatus Omnitrophota bacterium]
MKLQKPKFYFQSEQAPLLRKKLRALKEVSFDKKIADAALGNTFLVGEDTAIYMFHNVTKGWADFGDDIDWKKFKNTEKTAKVNRLSFLTSLGLMYFLYQRPQYLRKSLSLLRDWWKKNPASSDRAKRDRLVGLIWRSLNAAIRVMNLLWMFYFIKDSKQITQEEKSLIIEVIFDHGKYLYGINSASNYCAVNWQIHELVALAHLGILFPEFKEAEKWKRLAYRKLGEQAKLQFFPDGVHGEGSLSYHLVVAQLYLDALRIAQINHQRVPKDLKKLTQKMVNFAMAALRPDNTLPLVNDSHIIDLKTFILYANQMFPDNNWPRLTNAHSKDLILRYNGQLRNIPPRTDKAASACSEKKSTLFPDGGFAVMRDRKNTQHLFFDANPGWFPHTHAGKLSFDLYAHGKAMVIDAGNCSYDHCEYGRWYRRTLAHNTIQVNSRDQVALKDTWQWDIDYKFKEAMLHPNFKAFIKASKLPKVSIKRWTTNAAFDFIEAEHEGYRSLLNPLTHKRKILYIKGKYWLIIDELRMLPERASFASNYEFLLHFFPGRVKVDRIEKTVTVVKGNVGLQVVPLDKDGIDQLVMTKGKVIYGQRPFSSPFLKYIKIGRNTTFFYTLLFPFRGKPPKIRIDPLLSQRIDPENGTLGVAIKMPEQTDYFIHQPRRARFSDAQKKIDFLGKTLWLETKNRKTRSYFAIDPQKVVFLDKVIYQEKKRQAKT